MEIKSLKTNPLNQNNYNKNSLTPEFVGSLVVYPRNYTHEKTLACDGYVLKIQDYEQLYSVIGKDFNDGTESSDEFRIPDYNISGRFLQPNSKAGTKIEAGLPDIKGGFGSWSRNYGPVNGAFFSAGTTGGGSGGAGSGGSNMYYQFSASKSDSIYGRNSTVQPPAQGVHVCIRYK